jgi:hypothetical protein
MASRPGFAWEEKWFEYRLGSNIAGSRPASWRHGEAIVPIFIDRGAPFYARARQATPARSFSAPPFANAALRDNPASRWRQPVGMQHKGVDTPI